MAGQRSREAVSIDTGDSSKPKPHPPEKKKPKEPKPQTTEKKNPKEPKKPDKKKTEEPKPQTPEKKNPKEPKPHTPDKKNPKESEPQTPEKKNPKEQKKPNKKKPEEPKPQTFDKKKPEEPKPKSKPVGSYNYSGYGGREFGRDTNRHDLFNVTPFNLSYFDYGGGTHQQGVSSSRNGSGHVATPYEKFVTNKEYGSQSQGWSKINEDVTSTYPGCKGKMVAGESSGKGNGELVDVVEDYKTLKLKEKKLLMKLTETKLKKEEAALAMFNEQREAIRKEKEDRDLQEFLRNMVGFAIFSFCFFFVMGWVK